MQKLPTRIAIVVTVTILVIVLTAALSIVLLTRALDRQAQDQSEVQIRIVQDNFLERARVLVIDYTKWDAAFEAAQGSGDPEWLFRNIGTSALIGEAAQLTVIWGPGFESDLGWTDDGVVEPRSGLLPASSLHSVERYLASATPGEFDTAAFFLWRGDELFVVGASHFEPVEFADRIPRDERLGGLLLIGIRIDEEVAASIAESLSLTGVRAVRSQPADQPSLELPGINGKPVGFFVWDRLQPGTTMLRDMAPLLGILLSGAVFLAVLNLHFAKRRTQDLVNAEQRASHAARTDALTGLPNRAAFNEALARPARAGERAILFLDINDFKRINDSIGHRAGDHVIASVARRLAVFATPDRLLARTGGDEFVFVVSGPNAVSQTRQLAEMAADELGRPFWVHGHQMQLQASMGYAIQPNDEMTGDDLVHQADLAMYEAKRHKGGQPVAFTSILEAATCNAALIEQGLRKALERSGELSLVYQPISDTGCRMIRAEALARWTSPELGTVPPDRFIAVAERAGLIVQLGRKLIDLVCKDLVTYPGLKVSLNISPLQLMAPDFIPAFLKDLSTHNIDASRVEVELTESIIVDDARLALERIETLRSAGFTIALDDFGTGYSSMGYLARLRFDTLKIDRSFVHSVHNSERDGTVVDGMIRIAHALNLRVIAEGVETADEFHSLKELGCDHFQGYYLDPPLPIATLAERWLASSSGASGRDGVVVPLWSGRT